MPVVVVGTVLEPLEPAEADDADVDGDVPTDVLVVTGLPVVAGLVDAVEPVAVLVAAVLVAAVLLRSRTARSRTARCCGAGDIRLRGGCALRTGSRGVRSRADHRFRPDEGGSDERGPAVSEHRNHGRAGGAADRRRRHSAWGRLRRFDAFWLTVTTGAAPSILVVNASDSPNHCAAFLPTCVSWTTSPICQSRRVSRS